MEKIKSLLTLEGRVEHILKSYPQARNRDLELQAQLVYEFYPPLEQPIYNWKEIVYAFNKVPTLDHIARARRKVVARNKSLVPTSLEIAKARKISEDTWRAWAFEKPKASSGADNIPAEYQTADMRDEL